MAPRGGAPVGLWITRCDNSAGLARVTLSQAPMTSCSFPLVLCSPARPRTHAAARVRGHAGPGAAAAPQEIATVGISARPRLLGLQAISHGRSRSRECSCLGLGRPAAALLLRRGGGLVLVALGGNGVVILVLEERRLERRMETYVQRQRSGKRGEGREGRGEHTFCLATTVRQTQDKGKAGGAGRGP